MQKIHVGILVVGLLVALGAVTVIDSGCSGLPGKSQWELEVWISEEEQLENGTIELRGEVSMSGHVTGTTVEGVNIVFFNDENEISASSHIGTLSGHSQRNLTVKLDTAPDVIRIQTTDIQTGADTKYWIKGLKRDKSGQYKQFVQIEQRC